MWSILKEDIESNRMSMTLNDIREAAQRIHPYIHRTPVLTNLGLNAKVGAQVFLKCENMQKTGAFKFRGACNAVFSLTDQEASKGVCTHSSGNHAQALALAARLRGIPAYIVMPENAPSVKKKAVTGYGGLITFCAPTLEARETTLQTIYEETGANVVHPYNDVRVIAGQGTAALELLEEIPDLDVVLAPVGGGGLLSGTAVAATGIKKGIRVIAGEPEMADDAYRSMQSGTIVPSLKPRTIADGLLTSLGTLTFPVVREHVEQIVTVSERGIIDAMRFIWERAKIIIEPSAAVPVAVLWERKIDLTGLKVAVILSGGNVDLERLPWQSI
jgi:threonine dehydratase